MMQSKTEHPLKDGLGWVLASMYNSPLVVMLGGLLLWLSGYVISQVAEQNPIILLVIYTLIGAVNVMMVALVALHVVMKKVNNRSFFSVLASDRRRDVMACFVDVLSLSGWVTSGALLLAQWFLLRIMTGLFDKMMTAESALDTLLFPLVFGMLMLLAVRMVMNVAMKIVLALRIGRVLARKVTPGLALSAGVFGLGCIVIATLLTVACFTGSGLAFIVTFLSAVMLTLLRFYLLFDGFFFMRYLHTDDVVTLSQREV